MTILIRDRVSVILEYFMAKIRLGASGIKKNNNFRDGNYFEITCFI
jgi:hypothetical protein